MSVLTGRSLLPRNRPHLPNPHSHPFPTRADPGPLAPPQLNNVVTIFRSAIATTELAPGLFRTLLFGTFLAPVMIIFLEANKRTNPLWIQYSPILVGALAQTGGLVWLPIYYIAYLMFGPRRPAQPPTGDDATADEKAGAYDHANELRAVLPAVLVGYVIPALLLENPFVRLSQHQQDWINFTWQLFPLSIGLLIPLFRTILPTTYSTAHAVEQSALLWTSAICRLIHVGTILDLALRHPHARLSLTAARAAFAELIAPAKVAPLSRFIYQFLLVDTALCVFATAYFVVVVPGRARTSGWWVAGVMAAGAVVQGPGASLAWGWRTRRREAVVVERVKRQ